MTSAVSRRRRDGDYAPTRWSTVIAWSREGMHQQCGRLDRWQAAKPWCRRRAGDAPRTAIRGCGMPSPSGLGCVVVTSVVAGGGAMAVGGGAVVIGGGAVVTCTVVVGTTGMVTLCVVVCVIGCVGVTVVTARGRRRRRRGRRGGRARRLVDDVVLAPLERLPDRIGLRQREVLRRRVPRRLLHEPPPDLGREAAAGDRDPVHVLHRDLALRVADPDRRLEVRQVAAEPGVGVVVGRARLARGRAAEVRARAGPVEHVLLEDLRHRVGDAVRDHALALRACPSRPGRPPCRSRGSPCGSPSAASRCRRRRASRRPRPCRAARRRSSRARSRAPARAGSARRACAPCRRRSRGRRRGSAARRPCCRTGASPAGR